MLLQAFNLPKVCKIKAPFVHSAGVVSSRFRITSENVYRILVDRKWCLSTSQLVMDISGDHLPELIVDSKVFIFSLLMSLDLSFLFYRSLIAEQ